MLRLCGWLCLFLLVCAGLLALALYQSWIRIPPNWAPWGEVELDQKPSIFARMQINSLAADGEACYTALDRSMLEYRRLPRRAIDRNGCGLVAGVSIEKSHVAYSGGFQSTCGLTAALYWYEEDLDEAATTYLGTTLVRIDHVGSYACRNIYGEKNGRVSEHATANALDITGFRMADGTLVSIERDWRKDSAKGRFLIAAHDAACRYFNAVLSPDYNAAHATHFHVDLGRFRACR